MTTLALVALSARMLAEAATRDGYQALAIDLFGDTDTRRASRAWWPAGPAGALQIDGASVLAVLAGLRQRGDVAGWVAGSGCEGQPALLAEGALLLPLIGTAPAAVRRTRDPLAFFTLLAAQGIAHPEVRATAPAAGEDWLLKDALGCGGWHIRPAADVGGAAPPALHYFQRRAGGVPMSATFCANGSEAVVLGCNRLIVRAIGARPFVYHGVIGPVPLAATPARALARAVRLLTAELVLQGLCSLDFLLDGDTVQVLEVNPRPPASMVLYGSSVVGGIMAAHVDACLRGWLPRLQPGPTGAAAVRGTQIVFARRPLLIRAAAAQALQAGAGRHDLPAAGTQVPGGGPLCSVSATGRDATEVQQRLDAAGDTLLKHLETLS